MALKPFSGTLDDAPPLTPFAGELDPPTQATPATPAIARPSSTIRRVVGDTAVDLGKGLLGVGEAVVGAGNIVSGGYVGKGLEAIGYDPQTSKKMLEEGYTPERVAANKAVEDASGFVGTAKALIQNPSALIGTAVESAPLMLGGGAIARGGASLLGKAGSIARPGLMGQLAAIPQTIAGRIGLAAAGEGAVGAGAAAESIRQQTDDGLLGLRETGAALASGAGTAILGALGGKVAQKLGIADVDVALAGGSTARAATAEVKPGLTEAAKRMLKRVAGGALTEGVFEELPQSAQEQMWQNYATGKPIMDGVAEAAAMGALAGGVMGGGFSAVSGNPKDATTDKTTSTETPSGVGRPLSGSIDVSNAPSLDDAQPATPDPFDGNAINAELDAQNGQDRAQSGYDQEAIARYQDQQKATIRSRGIMDGTIPPPQKQAADNLRAEAQVMDAQAQTGIGKAAAMATAMQADAIEQSNPFGYQPPTFGYEAPTFPPAPNDGRTRLAQQAKAQGIDPRIVLTLDDAEAGELDQYDDKLLATYAKGLWSDLQSGRRTLPGYNPQEDGRGSRQDTSRPVQEQSGLAAMRLPGDAVPDASSGGDAAGAVAAEGSGGAASLAGQAPVQGAAAGAQAQGVIDALSAERRSRLVDGLQPNTGLDNALNAILIGGIDEQALMDAVRYGAENGRPEIAAAAAAELRKSANSAAKQKPGVPEGSPKYAAIAADLARRAQEAAKLADEAEAMATQPAQPAKAAPAHSTRDNPLPTERMGDAPVGSWVAGPPIPGTTPADTVRQIVEVPIEQIDATEFTSNGKLVADKQADASRYAEAMRNGDQFPNARGSVLPNGKIKLQDGHRRLAAAIENGATTLRVAVNPMPATAGQAPQAAATPTLESPEASRQAEVAPASSPELPATGIAPQPNQAALSSPDSSPILPGDAAQNQPKTTASEVSVPSPQGTPAGVAGQPNRAVREAAGEAPWAKDLKGGIVGWKVVEENNGNTVHLVNADGTKSVTFTNPNPKSGTEAIRNRTKALAWAADNPEVISSDETASNPAPGTPVEGGGQAIQEAIDSDPVLASNRDRAVRAATMDEGAFVAAEVADAATKAAQAGAEAKAANELRIDYDARLKTHVAATRKFRLKNASLRKNTPEALVAAESALREEGRNLRRREEMAAFDLQQAKGVTESSMRAMYGRLRERLAVKPQERVPKKPRSAMTNKELRAAEAEKAKAKEAPATGVDDAAVRAAYNDAMKAKTGQDYDWGKGDFGDMIVGALNRDPEVAERARNILTNGNNETGLKVFFKQAGVKFPKTQREQKAAFDAYIGVSKEDRAASDKAKAAAKAAEKDLSIANRQARQPIPDFKDYEEARRWHDVRVRSFPSKGAYHATSEYADYVEKVRPLHAVAREAFVGNLSDAMDKSGIKVGDRVETNQVGAFFNQQKFTGTVVMRAGVPWVKLDTKVTTSRKGRVSEASMVRWTADWTKIESAESSKKPRSQMTSKELKAQEAGKGKAAPNDSIDSLIEQYAATGRVVKRHPKKKQISVDGRTMPEGEAVLKMARVLGMTETITPANDTLLGNNPHGDPLYQRADGFRYTMRDGRVQTGGTLFTEAEQEAERAERGESTPPAPPVEAAQAVKLNKMKRTTEGVAGKRVRDSRGEGIVLNANALDDSFNVRWVTGDYAGEEQRVTLGDAADVEVLNPTAKYDPDAMKKLRKQWAKEDAAKAAAATEAEKARVAGEVRGIEARARIAKPLLDRATSGTPEQQELAQSYLDGDITLTEFKAAMDSKPAAQAASEPAVAAKIDDFGAKLEGARKFLPPGLKEEIGDEQLTNLPLSKVWPSDAHLEIEDPMTAAMAFTARNEIPAKPRQPRKVQAWVAQVKMFRALMDKFTTESMNRLMEIADEKGFASLRAEFFPRVQLLAQLPRDTWSRVEKVGHYPNARRLKTDEELKRDGFLSVLREGSTTYYDYFKVDPKTGKRSDRIVPWGATSALHDEMFTPSPHSTVTIDGKTTTFDVPAIGPDEVAKVLELLGQAKPEKGGLTTKDFEVRSKYGSKTAFINRKGDAAYRHLKDFTGDDAVKQAQAYLKENVPALAEAWEGVKARDNVGKGDIRRGANEERKGENRRNGKDVTEAAFEQAFGFRGVQFGNWVKQGKDAKSRQGLLNDAYDGLLDLADVLGIPSRAISLEGTLGLSLGAQGTGKHAATFHPDRLVINLTKTRGSGSLAHEWFHALDNYFARKRGGEVAFTGDNQAYRENNFITYKPEPMLRSTKGFGTKTAAEVARLRELNPSASGYKAENWEPSPDHKQGVRPVVEKVFAELVASLNASPMAKRSADIDGVKVRGDAIVTDGYWSRIIERGARSFESYVISKMAQRGWSNDFLVNIRSLDQWREIGKNESRYPYLKPEEEAPIIEAFDKLFETIEARQDGDNVVLESTETLADTDLTPAERASFNRQREYGFRGSDGVGMTDAEKSAIQVLDREESRANGIEDADKLGLRTAVNAAIGSPFGMPPITAVYLRGPAGLEGIVKPGYLQRLKDQQTKRGGKTRTAGLYLSEKDTVDGRPRFVLFTDTIRTPKMAAFTAAHEVSGHHGLRVLLGNRLNAVLEQAGRNPTVKAIADSMTKQRSLTPNQRLLAIEEALADLAAANATGNWQRIQDKHGVTPSKEMQSKLRAFIANVVRQIKMLFKTRNVGFSDAQVQQLLGNAFKAAQGQSASMSVVGANGALEQVVFHGTPHTVDKFSMQKIGTGEGAQAFGYGLYFASQKEIAESYRKNLSRKIDSLNIDWQNLRPAGKATVAHRLVEMMGKFTYFDADDLASTGLVRQLGDYGPLVDMQPGNEVSLRELMEGMESLRIDTTDGRDVYLFDDGSAIADDGEKYNAIALNAGNLYRVDVPEDADLLDWDKPLSEQPEKVRAAIERGGRYGDGLRMALGRNLNATATGQSIYKALSSQLGGPQNASERLLDLGVVGLRYLDGTSRAKGEGSANYVIWDESAIGTPSSALESTEDQTQSEAFKKWFGKSVVTENGKAGGKPLVVYKGMWPYDWTQETGPSQGPVIDSIKRTTPFPAFNDGESGIDIGGFFGDAETASRFAESMNGGAVFPVYLSIQNPYVVDAAGAKAGDIQFGKSGKAWRDAMRSGNYDGSVIRNTADEGTIYVTMRAEQVKSALANNGNFNPDSPSILESVEAFTLSDNPTPADTRIPGEITLDPLHKAGVKGILARLGKKFTDLKPAALALVPLQEMDDFTPKAVQKDGTTVSAQPAVATYIQLQNDMQAMRNTLYVDYDKTAQDLHAYSTVGAGIKGFFGKAVNQQGRDLFALMHDSTIAGVDPSEQNVRYKDPGKAAKYRDLQERYAKIPKEGQDLFKAVRDAYAAQTDLLDEVIEANATRAAEITTNRARRKLEDREREIREDGNLNPLEKAKASAAAKKAYDDTVNEGGTASKIAALRKMLEANRVPKPYFPLKRYGKYWVSVLKDGKLAGFSKFETAAEQSEFSKSMVAQGYSTRLKYEGDAAQTREMIDPKFVADVEEILTGLPDQIRDDVWQAYLERMPDMSLRKSFIHRKNVAGYHFDALKAFGSTLFHGSHQIARLKYGMEMAEAIDVAKEQANALRESDPEGALAADMVAGELEKRHAFIMNPTNAKWAQKVSGAAFLYSLGANPAHLFLNATQTIMLGVPILGTRYGFGRASKALTKAARDFAKGKGHLEKANLTTDELRAFRELQASGIIEKSQAHDIAGIGAEGVEYDSVRKKVMDKIGWFMHQSERFNREVTAMAGYRLARAEGRSHEAAMAEASKHVYQIHFDYSNAARARVMQGDMAKALLVFRNYQANMIYRLFRDIHQSIRGESPQVKREARKQLGAIMGMYGLFAGTMGVPFYGLAMALAGAFDDEDDPVTAEQQFVNGTVEFLGPTAAKVLLRGIPGTLFDVDLTERIGMGNLWFRSPNQEMEGRDAYYYWMEQLLGAGLAPVKGVFDGINLAMQGQFQRGMERASPAALRNPMQAIRMAQEGGVTSLDGDLIKEVNGGDMLTKALGFQPLSVSEQYEANNEIKGADRRLSNRRQRLMNRYFLARQMGDDTAEAMADIQAFNLKNPEYAITRDTMQRSAKTRARNSANSEGGIVMTRRMRRLQDRLNTEETE